MGLFFFGENLSRKKGDGFMNRPVTSALTKTQRGQSSKARIPKKPSRLQSSRFTKLKTPEGFGRK